MKKTKSTPNLPSSSRMMMPSSAKPAMKNAMKSPAKKGTMKSIVKKK